MTMRQLHLTYTPTEEDTEGFAAGLTGAGPWTSSSFTLSEIPDGLAHHITIDTAADLSLIDFTIVGTNIDGNQISEVIDGPNATLAVSVNLYTSLISVTADATVGEETFDVGWDDVVVTPTIPLEVYLHNGPVWCQVDLTGTANYDIEVTMSELCPDPNDPPSQEDYLWMNDANWTNKSADLQAQMAILGTALRLVFNSFSAGASLVLTVLSSA